MTATEPRRFLTVGHSRAHTDFQGPGDRNPAELCSLMGRKYWASLGALGGGGVLDGPGTGLLGFWLSYEAKSWFLRKRLAPLILCHKYLALGFSEGLITC